MAEACVCLLVAVARRRFPVVVAACVFPFTEKLILTLFAKSSLELQGRKRCPYMGGKIGKTYFCDPSIDDRRSTFPREGALWRAFADVVQRWPHSSPAVAGKPAAERRKSSVDGIYSSNHSQAHHRPHHFNVECNKRQPKRNVSGCGCQH